MNGNVALALLILGYLIAFCVYVVADVNRLCEQQAEQDELEALWEDGTPSALTLEAMAATGRAE